MTVSSDLQNLDETVLSMMETSQLGNGRQGKRCNVCGKEGFVGDIKRHIEANHVEGLEIPCNYCDKTFKSRNSLRNHISREHRRL